MRLAIVGSQGAGKSTLFRAFTGTAPPPVSNPSSPPICVVRVRDPRLEWLNEIFEPRKCTPVAVEVVDFPGLPRPDDTTGVKLGELLAAAREADGLIICVRAFRDPTYPYPDPEPRSAPEAADVVSELIFADLDIATRRVEKLDRKGGNMTDQEKREHAVLTKVVGVLEDGRPMKHADLNDTERRLLRGFAFLTEKPWVLVVSLPDEGSETAIEHSIEGPFEARVAVRAKLEAEIAELDEDDRGAFMEDLGLESLAAESVLDTAFRGLGTIVFFTTGEDEVRAWPIVRGTPAVQAAGEIHTDLERGFIRAEVYSWEELKEAGGDEALVKKAGKFRLEGKDYVVNDGDIFHVRFSV